MDTLPTSPLTPWKRVTARLECAVTIDDVEQPYKCVFPPTFVRWYPWGIWVDAGIAKDESQPGEVEQSGQFIRIDFPREPVETVTANEKKVLAVPVTGRVFWPGRVFWLSEWRVIHGMELPECRARRDPKRPKVFIVEPVILTGEI